VTFDVIPAIDLRGGRCVRLYQGDYEKETVYGEDPVTMAIHWQALGARRLHVVDLDGARSGVAVNAKAVHAIVEAVEIPVELGGGVRDMTAVEGWLQAGLDRVYLGTAAVTTPELVREACARFPGQIAVGADARDGRIATRGWASDSGEDVIAFARRVVNDGARVLTYTNVSKDGTFAGPDVEGAARLIEALQGTGAEVILAGGVGSLDHVLAAAAVPGLRGVIAGRALYEGRLDLAEALAAVAAL
jgi:phosphoribosylformimino-5-aminoimidazole carboxamide ribotide isomerase